MAYTRVVFQDGVTPLNATNMNNLDLGILNNESYIIQVESSLNSHIDPGNVVHRYCNISSDVGTNESYFMTPSTLSEEISAIRYQLTKIIGADTWYNQSFYGNNLSSHTNDIANLSEAVNISIPNDINNLSTQANVSLPNDISNLSTQANISLPNDISNLSATVYSRVFSISWNGSVSNNQYLIGGDSVDALYLFNSTATLIDARINLKFHSANGHLRLTFNKSSGTFVNWSKNYSNNSYYRETISLGNTVLPYNADGLSVQATNVSQLTHMFMTINYRE